MAAEPVFVGVDVGKARLDVARNDQDDVLQFGNDREGIEELIARIKAVLRRRSPQLADEPVEVSGLKLDPGAHRVLAEGTQVELGPTEFRLLHFFMTHPERVHSRAQLLDKVWGDHVFVEERTVDVHIRRLRMGLQPTGHDRLVQTVRGSGYRFAARPS